MASRNVATEVLLPECPVIAENDDETRIAVHEDGDRQKITQQYPDVGEGQLHMFVQFECS